MGNRRKCRFNKMPSVTRFVVELDTFRGTDRSRLLKKCLMKKEVIIMTKLLRRMITMVLVVICLVGTVAGCSNSSNNDNETKEALTTKKAEVTTTEAKTEPVTEEPTTERPTEYKPKGVTIAIPLEKAELFQDITITKGYKFVFNDIYSKEEYESTRGMYAARIVRELYEKYQPKIFEDYCNKIEVPGVGACITYEDNFIIEYTDDKTFAMHQFDENDVYAFFNLYEVK